MIIGIDGNEANIKEKVGIGQYAYQVLSYLYKIKNEQVKFLIYLKNPPSKDLPKETTWWKYEVFGPKRFWTQIALPYHLLFDKERPDVFFTPSHYAPRFSSCPSVISIMDLSFIHYPELFLKKDLHQLRSWTAYSVKKAVKIFTISQFSKKEIIKYYQLPEDKVIVTYPGYDEKRYQVSSIESQKYLPRRQAGVSRIKNKYNISDDYILFVGTLQPRKNIVRLIEAFNAIIKKYHNEIIQLVLVGKKGWLYDDIFATIKKLGLEKKVIFADFVTNDDLPYLYYGARCFVLPSLYEGFGIPAVEAMACGCPVVVSNVSSLPEIVGDAGILVDPQKVKDIAEGIYNAGFNELKRRELIKKGLSRAKWFNWEKCAAKALEILKQAKS